MALIKQCLFIDDDADDQDFFCETAKSINPDIECLFANTGIEAIAKFNEDFQLTPDCIFIDMNMPMMNGVECLAEIRQMERLSASQVYIYSTASSPKLAQEALDLGANEFLIKPSSVPELRQLLEKILL